ncbi:MAG TPA: DUF3370 domain-containing protein [Oscillatoriales cyanobacterium M59_W2019_021]|nr:MAG: DUF3370 domain-containing protein [Cyanobacteria bacterium J055]HIK31386.1 DUF3370 domain-containing protein [Oscillatoriales cyanobacterium M4454_W2019_049]HIK50803.1 DUF3370 domain-containing protein [Oscillatoriales cyanobacterium M59_W2019_021]
MKFPQFLLAGIFLAGGTIACRPLHISIPAPDPNAAAEPPRMATPNNRDIVRSNQVRSLPGQLDDTPMFNSNSPEWVKTEGILLSTFPPEGKQVPAAHLNFPFDGDFTIFAHHFTHTPPDLKTLYIGILVRNPGKQPVTLSIFEAASYLMEPDAPFKQQEPMLDNPNGDIFSGPGIRAVDNVLRGRRLEDFPAQIVIPPGQSRMLMNLPIPVRNLPEPINGRSSFIHLASRGQVYVASLAMYAQKNDDGTERAPTLEEWQNVLDKGGLAGPRDRVPTPPNQTGGSLVYGRVAGVQQGSRWQANLTDEASDRLTLPTVDRPISYVISTLRGGRLGTPQLQAAPMQVRYPDTAYESHGNYGVRYDLKLPLFNDTDRTQKVAIKLETPIKEDQLSQGGLRFRQPPLDFPFFRGTVRLSTMKGEERSAMRYIHLWHRQGQVIEPLETVEIAPQEVRLLRLEFLYPPDSVPPQVLTIETVK